MRILLFCFIFMGTSACQTAAQTSPLDFLIGTWKREGKTTYESWEKVSEQEYKGRGFKRTEDQEKTLEYLRIYLKDGKWVFEATVPDQNEGKSIPFTQNLEVKDWFSFENPSHDFPKKIQYRKTSESAYEINVRGDNHAGFSFKFLKVNAKE